MAYSFEHDEERGIDRIINGDTCTLTFSRYGGELIGYDVYDAGNAKTLPLMWNNANPEPPADGGWKNHATILFPIVGGLVNKRSTLGDVTISTKGNHGFCRHSTFKLAKTKATDDEASLTYEITPNDEIRGYYPFDFRLQLTYTLKENMLGFIFRVENTDQRAIWFSCGWHPGFSTDMGLGGSKADWEIRFEKGTYLSRLVDPDCYLTGKTETLELDGPIAWTEPQLEGTILLEVPDGNRTCTLYNPKLKRGVRVDFGDFPQFGLWSQEGKPFICLEPWQGMDDHLEQEPFDKKIGVMSLKPGEEMVKTAVVTPMFD